MGAVLLQKDDLVEAIKLDAKEKAGGGGFIRQFPRSTAPTKKLFHIEINIVATRKNLGTYF